jgi:hypothetical protein
MPVIKIDSYETAKAVFSTARNKAKGKPLGRKDFRLYQHGDEFVIRFRGYRNEEFPVCRISSDNKMEFVAMPEEIYQYRYTLSQMMCKITPFDMHRISTGRYRIGKTWYEMWGGARLETERGNHPSVDGSYSERSDRYHYMHQLVRKEVRAQPEYYAGICFDLDTKRCINPRPDRVEVRNIDKEKRKVWIAAKRKLERDLKARYRIGVLPAIIDELRRNEDSYKHGVYLTDIQVKREVVLNALNADVITKQHMRGLVLAFCRRSINYTTKSDDLARVACEQTINFLKSQSVYFREQFGVFKDGET